MFHVEQFNMKKTNLQSVKDFWKRNPEKRVYYRLKSNAKRRGIFFNLSYANFLEIINGTDYMKLKGKKPYSLTFDRIDENRGYIMGNIQIITFSDNVTKQRKYENKAPF